MTEKSELERQLEQVMPTEVTAGKVSCLCVHGTCREGEAECSGGCQSGYTGVYCDAPTSDDVLKHVNKNKHKDYTGDGLYRPQQISEQRLTSTEHRQSESSSTESSHSSGGSLRAQKIDGELSSYSSSGASYSPPVSHLEQAGPPSHA
jgi:hypothetical protein